MTALLTLAFLITSCTGFGAATLRAAGVLGDLTKRERLTWAFVIGYGILGWLLFFVGIVALYQSLPLLLLLGIGTLGLFAFVGAPAPTADATEVAAWGSLDGILATALAIVVAFDIIEGLAPPADADSLAYHFALAKQFIAAERLFFVERALDGATPLLNQMTYIPALAFGGEKGLTLWAMVSGWGATALLYSISRRYLDRRWSLAVAVVFLSTPAIVYGGGSGQVEVRNAMFATLAALSAARAVTLNSQRYAVLAGLGVGFFMAGKYIGLLFAFACGLSILLQRRWFVQGLILTVVALIAGSQWYIWNTIHTGDPFFPLLMDLVGTGNLAFWNPEQQATLKKMLLDEGQGVPLNVLWLVLYPFFATLSGYREFESGRTGFGPYVLLLLPFAVAGAWKFRQRLRHHSLFIVAFAAILFYVVWFFTGSSQRVRHLVPVMPLVVLIFTVAAHRCARDRGLLKPLMAATLVTVSIQLAGLAVFGQNYVRYFTSGESREAFLLRNVDGFGVVPWINNNLKPDDRLYLISRQLNYHLDIPYFYAHVQGEGWIDIRQEANNPLLFLDQLRGRGISHLLVDGDISPDGPVNGLYQWRPLLHAGCLEVAKSFETLSIGSRSLGRAKPNIAHVLKVKNKKCIL